MKFELFFEPSKAHNLYDGDSWMLAEHIPDLNFYFSQIWLHAFPNEMEHSIGVNYSKVICFHHGYDLHFYYGSKDCHNFALNILNNLKKSPAFGEKINKNIVKWSDKLAKDSEKVSKMNLKKLSNKQLWELYWKNIEIHLVLYSWGWLPNAVDMFYPELTDYLKNLLRKKVKDEAKLNEVFVKLTAANEETISSQETKSLLKIAIDVFQDDRAKELFANSNDVKNRISPLLRAKFEEHWEKFNHLQYLYHGNVQIVDFYYRQMTDFIKSGKNPVTELEKLEKAPLQAAEEKQKLIQEYKIDVRLQRLLAIYAKFMVTKWYRRNSQILCMYYGEKLLKEIGNRLNLSLAEVRVMLWEEVQNALVDNLRPDRKALQERVNFFVFYVEKEKRFVFTGDFAKQLELQASKVKIDLEMKELKGQCACLGKARGKAKIVLNAVDSGKMHQGDILVSIATDPDLVPAMKKAAAIITEQGGVTSHAAIISRELNIPCVIGTKVATKWLKDGDEVEVDATNGIVKKL